MPFCVACEGADVGIRCCDSVRAIGGCGGRTTVDVRLRFQPTIFTKLRISAAHASGSRHTHVAELRKHCQLRSRTAAWSASAFASDKRASAAPCRMSVGTLAVDSTGWRSVSAQGRLVKRPVAGRRVAAAVAVVRSGRRGEGSRSVERLRQGRSLNACRSSSGCLTRCRPVGVSPWCGSREDRAGPSNQGCSPRSHHEIGGPNDGGCDAIRPPGSHSRGRRRRRPRRSPRETSRLGRASHLDLLGGGGRI